MNVILRTADAWLGQLPRAAIVSIACAAVLLVGSLDYLTGYELAWSLFYLGPVSLVSWYVGGRAAVRIALVCAIAWMIADQASGHIYQHPAFLVWNSLIRLGIFLVCALSLAALRESLNEPQRLARVDPLTGLYTRRAFEARLAHDLELCRRRGDTLSIAYIDLDNFKAVNDARGHAAGDQVLRSTAQVLSATIRRADTAARLGGDEFALVLPDTDRTGAEEVVVKLMASFRETFADTEPMVGCSVGVVTFREIPPDAAAALARADALMYQVKHAGKNRSAFEEVGATPGHVATQ